MIYEPQFVELLNKDSMGPEGYEFLYSTNRIHRDFKIFRRVERFVQPPVESKALAYNQGPLNRYLKETESVSGSYPLNIDTTQNPDTILIAPQVVGTVPLIVFSPDFKEPPEYGNANDIYGYF